MAGFDQLGQTPDGANVSRNFAYKDGSGAVAFNTFSGTDMRVFFGPKEVGTLMSITIGVTREKAPIYTCLGTNPRGFTRGKRAISGTMIFGQFDRHALLYGPFSDYLDEKNNPLGYNEKGAMNNAASNSGFFAGYSDIIGSTQKLFGRQRQMQYADQLPPFDIVITFSNDAGAASVWKVIGAEIISEGYGFTQDDTSQDMACSYAAREVLPLTPVKDVNEPFGLSMLRHERANPLV